MDTLKHLTTLVGHGTSMITITIATNPKALDRTVSLLNSEYSISANIKSRV